MQLSSVPFWWTVWETTKRSTKYMQDVSRTLKNIPLLEWVWLRQTYFLDWTLTQAKWNGSQSNSAVVDLLQLAYIVLWSEKTPNSTGGVFQTVSFSRLFCFFVFFFVLFCFVLFCFVLFCFVLFCCVVFLIVLFLLCILRVSSWGQHYIQFCWWPNEMYISYARKLCHL